MSGGFNDPIIGGGGALVYPAIHSPNFSQGPPITGWSIRKDGSAFFSGTIGGLTFEITSAGAFFYSGTPAHGNLIASITSAAGTDPFGNPFNAGITSYDNTFGGVTNILGAVIKLFAGVTQRALLSPSHFSVFNSSGATIYDVDLSLAAQFLYADTGSAVQGALVASQSQNSGTDQFGNPYQAGVNEYITISGTKWAVTLAQSVAAFGGTLAGLTIDNLSVPWSIPASVTGLDQGGAELELSSGLKTAGGTQSAIILQDSALGGTGGLVVVNAGNFTAQTPSPNPTLLQVLRTGRVQVILPDGNTYRTERLSQQVSPRSQSFSAVAAANILGLSVPVIAGTYIVRGSFTIEWNAAAGIPQMVFAGPAVSQYDVRFRSRQSGSSSTANTNSLVAAAAGNGTGYNGTLVNVTQAMSGAGIFFEVDVSGEFTFTASGTLTLQAASSIATDAWIVVSGSWDVEPK